MKLSDRTYIIILIAVILLLGLAFYQRFTRIKDMPTQLNMPEFEIPAISNHLQEELLPAPERKGETEWISPDSKLKLIYPDNWRVVEDIFLEQGVGTGFVPTEEVLLFAYYFKIMGQAFPHLIVGQVGPEKSLENIVEETKQNIKASGGEVEVTALETDNGISHLDMLLKYPGQTNIRTRGKIIFTEEKTYIITFSASQQAWSQVEKDAEMVLNSVELL